MSLGTKENYRPLDVPRPRPPASVVPNKSSTIFTTEFPRGTQVNIDGDESIIATVCGHIFRERYAIVECLWFCNGDLKTVWVEDWRLRRLAS